MIWADRVALLVEIPVVWLAISLSAVFVPTSPAAHVDLFQALFGLSLAIVLPLWLTLRVVDLIFDGPRRRRITAREPLPPAARPEHYEVLPPLRPNRG